MIPRIKLCLTLVLSGGLLGGFSGLGADKYAINAEPRYLDKSLSEWIAHAAPGGEFLIPWDSVTWQAHDAVRQIGTNAIPWLLQWLRSDQPKTAQLGIGGCCVLGPSGTPAIPELLKMAYDWQNLPAWSNAVLALASLHYTNSPYNTFAYFVPLVTNQSVRPIIRAQTLAAIGRKIRLEDSAVPVLLQCLRVEDSRVATAAAYSLGRWSLEPRLVIPARVTCLSSRTNGPEDAAMRDSAADGLMNYAGLIHDPSARSKSELDDLRQAMSNAVPALVKALDDEDWRVAREAAMALGAAAIEPDIVVPALVKSLNYPHPHGLGDVRHEAINALGNFGEAAQSAAPALTKIAQSDSGGYVGGGFAATVLKKIAPATKP